jgi:RsiW-degrading membrane proteinase PrsW (M82 family)
MIIFLIVAAATTVAWSHMYLRRDRFEPEPRGLLVKLFIAGACVTLLAGSVNTVFALMLPEGLVVILVAPPMEELFKIAAVLLVAYRSQHFTQVVDGAIYGISCALGFAVVENLGYAAGFGVATLALRSILLPVGHLLFTGVAGYYLGKAKFENGKGYIALGFVAAVLLHMGWNAPSGLSELASDYFLFLYLTVIPLYIFFVVRLLRGMGSLESQAIRRLVQPRQVPTSAN